MRSEDRQEIGDSIVRILKKFNVNTQVLILSPHRRVCYECVDHEFVVQARCWDGRWQSHERWKREREPSGFRGHNWSRRRDWLALLFAMTPCLPTIRHGPVTRSSLSLFETVKVELRRRFAENEQYIVRSCGWMIRGPRGFSFHLPRLFSAKNENLLRWRTRHACGSSKIRKMMRLIIQLR